MIKLRRHSFLFKIMTGLVVVLILLGTVNIIQTRIVMNKLFAEQQEKRGISITNMLASRAANLILVQNYYDLHELVKDTTVNNDDVRYAFVVSNGGELLAHSFGGGFPKELLTANIPDNFAKYHIAELSTEEGVVWDIAVPVFDGRLGIAHVGMSDASLRTILQGTTRQLLLETFAVVVLGIAFMLFYAKQLTKPIRELVRVTSAITQGDFTQRARIDTKDEFGQLSTTFNRMTDYLDELLTELHNKEEARTHLLQKVIVAQEEERKRIARELHDETGQTLTSLMMGLKYLADSCPGNSQFCQLEDMRMVVKRTLDEIHRLSVELRPSILDDMGLVAALEKYVGDYRDNLQIDVDLHVSWQRSERLSHEIEVTVYRIVQEALTNAAKYSEAQNMSVLVTCTQQELTVIIEDAGVGFVVGEIAKETAIGNKLGLYGMYERATSAGGALTIESTPGIGTTIYLRIPFSEVIV